MVCLKSVEMIYRAGVEINKVLNYLLTYKLSQYNLEMTFSLVISSGGFNNPSARFVKAAYVQKNPNTQQWQGDRKLHLAGFNQHVACPTP